MADLAFGRLRSLPISDVDTPADVARAYDLSRRHDGHPLYDMVYVALAERLRTTVVTADARLSHRLPGSRLVTPVEQALQQGR